MRLYSTRSEQREAGIEHKLTPWLSVAGLAEFEWEYDNNAFSNLRSNHGNADAAANVQLHSSVTPLSFASGELILNYDTDQDRLGLDEATAALELGDWELGYGRQYLPFGVYFSHFASAPLLEFGETRDVALNLDYDYGDRFSVSAALFRGQGRNQNSSGSRAPDWALALSTWVNGSLRLGASYLSDLADADGDLLADNGHRHLRQVGAYSAYLLWSSEHFEVTAEAIAATGPLRELPADRNQPLAWNLEFAQFLHAHFDWALRLEGSRELQDAAQLRYGASISFRAGRYASLTLDYLRSRYKPNFVRDDGGHPLNHADRLAAQLSIAF